MSQDAQDAEIAAPPGDPFSDVLAALDFSSQLYFRADLGRPFSLLVPEQPGVIRFHVVARGRCTIAVAAAGPPGEAGPPDSSGAALELGLGDLVLVPHGASHVLADAPGRQPTPLDAALEASGFDGVGPFVFGGTRAEPTPGSDGREAERTVLACGHFSFGPPADLLVQPLGAPLPRLLHVRADARTSYAWIEPLLEHIEREARARRAGSQEVVRRLSEILCIELLRAYAGHGSLAVLSALADPQLGRALRALHARPEADWSLERLARTAGLSRTLFVERFRERMGVPPMKYLTAWRMQKARSLLARAGCSVAEVAQRVGYASESAFNRTFRAQFGAPPGSYRRAQREP